VTTERRVLAWPSFSVRCSRPQRTTGITTRIDRRREFSGPGFDQLNLWLRERPDELMLRMVATPDKPRVIDCGVVADWRGEPSFDDHVKVARSAFMPFLRQYSTRFGHQLRLGLERKGAISR
jgi:hypothetical protein